MAYLGTSEVSFPDFEQSRNYFRTGVGSPPQASYSMPNLESWGGGGGSRYITSGTSSGGTVSSPAPSPQPQQPTQQPTQQPPQQPAPQPEQQAQQPLEVQSPAPYKAPTLGYGNYQGGDLKQSLFNPVQQAAQQGSADVVKFADMFRQQAGPSRTYQGIGAESTLGSAVEGGPLEPARQLVQAEYQGPAGLDPNAVGALQFLAGQLGQRQKNLGTGAGLTSTIGQTVGTLTPGEARYDARALFTPEYRQALAGAMAPVGQFTEQLGTETQAAQDFAAQRAAEESDIARRAAEYLTGRRSGIESDIGTQLEAARQQQQDIGEAYGNILNAEDVASTVAALRAAEQLGALGFDANELVSPAMQAQVDFPAQQQAIMDAYPQLKNIPLGQLGVDGKGRQTYLVPNDKGEMVDFRNAMSTEDARAFKQRQFDLEQQFAPGRGLVYASGQRTSGDYFGRPDVAGLVNPMYHGDQFEGPKVQSYLQFDPGVTPSRGNVSTAEQRDQYNRINDLLDNMDRIAEQEPWRAAQIGAEVDSYLADEEDALNKQAEKLDAKTKEWFYSVKKLRKKVRQKEREAPWAKIGRTFGRLGGAPMPFGGQRLGVSSGEKGATFAGKMIGAI